MKRAAGFLFACAAAVGGLRGEVTLAPVFSDHAVLQRDKPVPIWGRAAAQEEITVEFHGQKLHTAADAAGRWRVTLAPLPASADGADLVVQGKDTVTLRDVVVGEVWLCAGQSNMEFPLQRARNGAGEVATANFPLIRELRVTYAVADTPQDTAPNTGWRAATPATAGHFTAVGYFFAREISATLPGVPIGLVNNARGGSPIEAWLDADTLASDPAFAVVTQRWADDLKRFPENQRAWEKQFAAWQADEAGAKAAGESAHQAFLKKSPAPPAPHGPGHYWTPSGLHNAMLYPLLPYALRGILWYQGESNLEHAAEYRRLFSALILQWRREFAQGELPFYWVQLPNYIYSHDKTGLSIAWLREAQGQTLKVPGTAQAVTIDVGDPDNVHPTDKQAVGHRLALLAKTRLYGDAEEDSGPVFASAKRDGAALRVRFQHAAGLMMRDATTSGWEIAGADRNFFPAMAVIANDAVLVSSPQVPEPAAVRYAWSNSPTASLYNAAGLPAAPFRSDNW